MIIYQSPAYDTFTDEFTIDSCVSTNLLPLYCDLRDGSKLSIRGDLRTGELSVKGESPIGAVFGTHASGQFTVTSSGWTFIGTDPDSDLTANGYAWYHVLTMDKGAWSYRHGTDITEWYRAKGTTDWTAVWSGSDQQWSMASREMMLVPYGDGSRSYWRTTVTELYAPAAEAADLVSVPEPGGASILALGVLGALLARAVKAHRHAYAKAGPASRRTARRQGGIRPGDGPWRRRSATPTSPHPFASTICGPR